MSTPRSGVITDLEELVAFTGPLLDPVFLPLTAILILILATKGVEYLNTSFRYEKGLYITSPTSLNVYATDRNVWPLAGIPAVGTNENFAMVKFTSQS
jgi:hypothetical protein